MIDQPQITVDLPVTEDQASLLLAELSPAPDVPWPTDVTHILRLGEEHCLPGCWRVNSVRREYLNGQAQHFVSLEWQP